MTPANGQGRANTKKEMPSHPRKFFCLEMGSEDSLRIIKYKTAHAFSLATYPLRPPHMEPPFLGGGYS